MRYFSMFTGVGGFELGIGQKGECVGFSEIDKYASMLLNNKYPAIKNYGDARKINPEELPDFDLLCGGFPCQAFSIAGKRRGFEDIRGTLFFEIARILKVKRPKIILLENVKGLLNHEKGKTFKIILQTLDELGYEVQWMVLNSKFFGVPQNRERVFIIGNLRGKSRPEILPFRKNYKEVIVSCGQKTKNTGAITSRYYKQGNADTYIMKKIVFTLTGQDIHGVMNNKRIRRLTPPECERLQGFPDNWTEGFSDTQRYKMMGNAVTVNVIREISKNLL